MLDQALEIAHELGDRSEEAEGMRSHGLTDLFQGRLESATKWFGESLAGFRELGDKRGEGWSLVNLGWVDLLLGRLDGAMSELEQGASIFGEIGDTEGVGWCLGLRVWVLLFQGKLSEAEALQVQIDGLIAQALRPTPRGMGSFGWGIGRVARSFIAIDRARYAEAEELGRQALSVFQESDAVWGLAMARFPLGIAQLTRRLLDEARQTYREAIEAAEQSSDPMVKALCTHGMAMVEGQEGNLDEAERLADKTMELTEGTGVSWISEIPAKSLKAMILRERGKTKDARAVLESIRDVPQGLYEEARAICVLSEIESDEGAYAEAIATAQRGIDVSGEDVLGRAWCLRALARAHHLSGDQEAAEQVLRDELELLEKSDWDEERVHILALLARVLDEQGRHDEAGVMIDDARKVLGRFPAGAKTDDLAKLLVD
jgi:tetratricopeptide (TPR) repeat protein